ncbi:hypothetical protein E1B28_001108 [Marasmius oreades]|uniref:YDG domain-containing protein n=1 Tax=Marasmius oreades TaxID=181124 RepID=A0A9P7V2T6_9AGAR|nr:uncharacterized protein E1B28_001108 [Marasmius oreades]KAG7099245.1 hypothetical protein E1B28_001108 [Marasmius oreades]
MPALSEYEEQRLKNIERNKALLKELGLDTPKFEPTTTRTKTQKVSNKKRKTCPSEDTANGILSPVKVFRETEMDDASTGLRRSSRNAGKTVDYKAERVISDPTLISVETGIRKVWNAGPQGGGGLNGKRVHDPKVFGSIPGIEVGTWWETRQECSIDAVHAPFVAGISGGPKGAYSVALSGGYEDDVDLGYAFTYTGSGGRDLKGTKTAPKNLRTAPQSSDQSFDDNFNRSLKISSETKKPVRVIRGYKLKSPYAPYEGYRFDGLYIVEKAWMEKGLNRKGFKVCKFAFKRIPGQPPLPVREEGKDSPATENQGEQSESA